MIVDAFVWTISAGSVLAMIGSVAALAWILKRGDASWRSVAEARAAELVLKEAELVKLRAETALLKARPTYELVSERLEVASGLLVRHGLLLDQIEDRLDKHAAASAEQYAGMLKALDAHTEALSARDEAIIEALMLRASIKRDPSTRTRSTDEKRRDAP